MYKVHIQYGTYTYTICTKCIDAYQGINLHTKISKEREWIYVLYILIFELWTIKENVRNAMLWIEKHCKLHLDLV